MENKAYYNLDIEKILKAKGRKAEKTKLKRIQYIPGIRCI